MAKAALELPDPLEQPAAAGVASADDLLSQLAGDEIDRLLAEADVRRPADAAGAVGKTDGAVAGTDTAGSPESAKQPGQRASDNGAGAKSVAETATAEPAPSVPPSKPAAGGPISPPAPLAASVNGAVALAKGSTPATDTSPSVPAAAHAVAENPLAGELDELFKQLEGFSEELNKTATVPVPVEPPAQTGPVVQTAVQTTSVAEATANVPPPSTPAASPSAAVAPAPAAPSAAIVEAQTTVAERDALKVSAAAETPLDADLAASDADEEAQSDEVPIYLKPLVWLSAPLAGTPWLSNLVGQLAILTTLNAIAVLIYVFVFRKH